MTWLQELVQFLTVGAGVITAISFVPQIWKMYRTKRSMDLSVTTYGMWTAIPLINLTHLWFEQDWYMSAGIGIGWLAALITFAQVLYYRQRVKKVRVSNSPQYSAPIFPASADAEQR